MDNLSELVENAQKGQRSSFETLIRHYSRMVFAKAYLMTRDKHEAEDLTQDAFFKAWDRISTLNDPTNFKSWLMTIVRHQGLDQLKKKKLILEILDNEKESPLPPPDHHLFQQEIQQKILDSIDSLEEKYKEPLMLRYMEGYNHKQIQEATGLAEGSLKGMLNRGIKKLREQLTPLYNEINNLQDKGNLHEEV